MRTHLSNWIGQHCVVSVARDSKAFEKLKRIGLPFWLVEQSRVTVWPDGTQLQFPANDMEQLQFLNNYDIIEVMEDGFLLRLYDDASNENIIFVTGRCNSNCIMCPSPTISRKKGEHTPLSSMLALAERLPSDVGHLTITGGEPFLAGEGLFQVLSLLKQNCPNTEYLILTNGRALAIKQYQSMLEQSVPSMTQTG